MVSGGGRATLRQAQGRLARPAERSEAMGPEWNL
jgi:hypothetical protein